MSFRVVVTDFFDDPSYTWDIASLRKEGISLSLLQLESMPMDSSVVSLAQVLVVDRLGIDAQTMHRLNHCQAIIRHGDGYDTIDVDAATSLGILCANKPGFWSTQVAIHALSGAVALLVHTSHAKILALLPKGIDWNSHPKDITWPALWHQALSGKKVGVVGFGRIGSLFARYCQQLNCEVAVHDPTITDTERARFSPMPAEVPKETLIQSSDIISLHIPGTPRNRHWLAESEFLAMKRNAVVINCARGALINTNELTSALQRGTIAGAALDTTDPEPLPLAHPLRKCKQCILTPHIAWYTPEGLHAIRASIIEDIRNITKGVPPASLVNPEVLEMAQCRLKLAGNVP